MARPRRIPELVDGVLHLREPSGGPEIAVGSPSWVAWLTDPATRSFSFRSPGGSFTARKELRARGGEYWVPYRKQGGRLHKSYLGKAEDTTSARLAAAASELAARGGEATASPAQVAIAGGVGLAGADAAEVQTTADDQVEEGSSREAPADPLLLTKLSVPLVRPSFVPRPRLSEQLGEGLGRKLTLLSAPAGFGKTTLLGAWTSGLSDGRPVAWLSLDSGDNDPARFWR